MPNRRPARFLPAIALLLVVVGCMRVPLPPGSEEPGIPVRFTYENARAKQICIAGTFNGWSFSSQCMVKNGSSWSITLYLAPGRYEYVFVVDRSTLEADPNAVLSEESGFGTMSSVLLVE
jgi:hypothetical protein